MIREIGSEFWDVPICDKDNTIFPDNTEWYQSGRSALIAIISDIKKRIDFKSVALPSWCCHSMILPFLNEKVMVKFYSVYFECGQLKYDFSEIYACDAILIMDYFGFIRNIEHNFKGIVINDITHSVFRKKNHSSDYTFGSLRKWAGFFTGGFAYKNDGSKLSVIKKTNNEEYISVRKLAMSKKTDFINGETDNKDFLSDFSYAEDILDTYLCGEAFDFDVVRAKKLDVDFIKRKRRANASVILKSFADIAIFSKLEDDDCPLFVPLVIPDGKRDKLRKYLIERKIYCPIHWPVSEYHSLNSETRELYEREISIVCDQRYNISDMEYICVELKNYFRLG